MLIFIISGMILPLFGFSQAIKMPETLEEGKTFGWDIVKNLPREFLKIGQKIWEKGENIWDSYLLPWLKNVWGKILSIFGQEIERRKEIIKKEFPGEKEEMKKEIKTEMPKISRTLWERFKELIK